VNGGQLRACVAAFTFLTRLPVSQFAEHDASDLPAATAYFPAVGLVVGLIGGLVYLVASFFWPPLIAVILSVAATVLSTGAFHEDALADSLDGFGGGWTHAQVLSIMKDSRVGSYALVGVVLALATKVAVLTDISASSVGAVARALVAGHVLGRWSSVPLIWRWPYVRPTEDGERPSAGRPFAASVTGARLFAATVFSLVVVGVTLEWRALAVCVVAAGVTWLSGQYFNRRIGGITGDALGAANQLVELAVYLTMAARLPS
jgi:adenosylcobinamide-GDP ribazoletransferase